MRSDTTRRAAATLTLALALGLGSGLAARPALAQEVPKPRIGVIGAGNIGGTIGGLWVKAGYKVMFASRNPDGLKGLVEGLGPDASAGTPAEAIRYGEAVLLAVPYKAYPDLAAEIGPMLKGKVVLDAGNATKARDGDLYETVQAEGIAATSRKYFPEARLVRAFNAANFKVFAKNSAVTAAAGGGGRAGGRMAIPIAGDDPEAVAVAGELVRGAGFEPVVVGPLKAADTFAMGTPGFGHDLTVPELREKLGLGRAEPGK